MLIDKDPDLRLFDYRKQVSRQIEAVATEPQADELKRTLREHYGVSPFIVAFARGVYQSIFKPDAKHTPMGRLTENYQAYALGSYITCAAFLNYMHAYDLKEQTFRRLGEGLDYRDLHLHAVIASAREESPEIADLATAYRHLAMQIYTPEVETVAESGVYCMAYGLQYAWAGEVRASIDKLTPSM